ncbi:hypothetical protein AB6A40_007319 [Gnathostoma spinigerum]|uniref:Glycerol-3-phosphate dehydrogenase [NAD(+)] n=1 Tax=Gnathostoma spinigerum TaxID=75299 RepID=A0ABD6EWH4_9BILA
MLSQKITIVGSGNWGSAIARIVGKTTVEHKEFDSKVLMWVYEEIINGRKLTEIINTEHENVKYLPGKKLPANVIAVPDLRAACESSDVLIFVIPHQFISNVCKQIAGHIKTGAHGVSLVKIREKPHSVLRNIINAQQQTKGLMNSKKGGIRLVSEEIHDILGIDVSVLMGANLAPEVANDDFCEATIGCKGSAETRSMLKKLFQTENFRINVVRDAHTVELCGALKNIVACAAGITDGLGYGDNTKAAVIRLGLMEITKFVEHFYPGSNLQTFFESCGIADLITTCYGGRNRKVCEAFVKTGKSIKELEISLLKGQSAQGPLTASEVNEMIKHYGMSAKFPLFAAVDEICNGAMQPAELINCLRDHPEHL